MKQRLAVLVACSFAMISTAHAKIEVVGKGADVQIDARRLPKELQGAAELLKTKCTVCHSAERIVIAVSTGVAPVSGQPFTLEMMRSTVNNMTRKANAGTRTAISREESREITALLKYLLGKADM